tara:strand:- start:721 stop:1026 length:306 start_codon:yes stop_codon:yes gene_type:complete
MNHRKPFLENKSLFVKWFKHELTGKSASNGVGMMEKKANDKTDNNWIKLSDPFKNDTTDLKYGIVVAEKNFDPTNWVNDSVTLTEMTEDEIKTAKGIVNWE